MTSKKQLHTAVLLLLISHIASILTGLAGLTTVGRLLIVVGAIAICLVVKESRRCQAALVYVVLQLIVGVVSDAVWGPATAGEEAVAPAFVLAIVVTALNALSIRFLFFGLGERLREHGADKAADYGGSAATLTVARCIVTALLYLLTLATALMSKPTGTYIGGAGLPYLLLTLVSGLLVIVEYVVHLLYFVKCLKGLKSGPTVDAPQ